MTEPAPGPDALREPAGLYLHIPYCSAICPYCDFAVRRGDGHKADTFADVLVDEIAGVASGRLRPEAQQLADAVAELAGSTFDSVYFGGGTPSLLSETSLEKILDALREHFRLAPHTRLYLEANPEHVSLEHAQAWRRLGIQTLSLGVQALDQGALRFLGRAHGPDDARRAVAAAREAAFDTVSIDLIYGLPGQTPDDWRRQLDQALDLEIDHLSLYELEIHERTSFGKMARRGQLEPLDEDARGQLFLDTHRRLAGSLDAYEVSNFARSPKHRSRHNQKYWRHVPYLGLGPSAHSLAIGENGPWRSWNERLEPRWRRLIDDDLSPAAGWERLPQTALALEAAMLGLRTRDGLDLDHAQTLSGIDLWPRNAELFERWLQRGWHHIDGRRLRPTFEGLARADRLAAEIDVESPTE